MTDISYPVLRTEKTDIAGSVVVTPSGGSTGNPIVAADLVNGFAPVTVAFAAGETTKPVSFPVADDALVEGTETYRLTMSNPLPSGTFPSGAFVEGSIGDNDSAPAPAVSYGPQDTVLPRTLDTQSSANFAEFVFTPAYQEVHLCVGDLTGGGADCIKLKMLNDSFFQIVAVRGGAETVLTNPTLAPANGQRVRITQFADKSAVVTLDGSGVPAGGVPGSTAWPSGTPGTWTRAVVTAGASGATKGVALGAQA